jgi:hypothetical protein
VARLIGGPGEQERPAATLVAMNTDSRLLATAAVPDKPTLDGIEAKWMPRWAKERVVQV